MKKLLLLFFVSCNYSNSTLDVKKKVQFIDSTLNHREIRIVRREVYMIPDSIISGGLEREFVSSTDSVLLVIKDKKLYDSVEFYYSAFFINSNLALIDMRAIKDKKLTFINKGYYDNDSLIFEDIQDQKQGKPSILLNYFKSAAQVWYKKNKK